MDNKKPKIMKKIVLVGVFFILLAMACQAQSIYTMQNLKQASQENLDSYLKKAHKLKKAGAVVTITGSTLILTGIILVSTNQESAGYVGIYTTLVGLPIAVIGLPILITGSSRVKKINKIRNLVSDEIYFEIAPCSFHDNLAQNYQSGITLRLRF